ncbi:hypothetical protein BG004_006179 [Podila humilis]|nr:hypothetical protein BG004_006179 [Podila humilis]
MSTSFLPATVRDLVSYDPAAVVGVPSDSSLHILTPDGMLSLSALRSVLPAFDRNPEDSFTADDFLMFKVACCTVDANLSVLSHTQPLRELYSTQLSFLGDVGATSGEIWLELHEQGLYDQGWLVGSTVLEQLLANVQLINNLFFCS